MDRQLVEAVAEAMYGEAEPFGGVWFALDDKVRQYWRGIATVGLQAAKAWEGTDE